MNFSKNIRYFLKLKVIFIILLCANPLSLSKQIFHKKHVKTLKTSKDKYKSMLMPTTGDSLSTDNRNFKLQRFGKVITFFDVSNQLQTVTYSRHKYKPRKHDTMFHNISRIKRYANEDMIQTQTHGKINQTKIIAPPTKQCYLCKSSADIVSSIGSLNLTHKYNGMQFIYFLHVHDKSKI